MPALPDDHPRWPALRQVLTGLDSAVSAVSGGVDSLLLTTLAHRLLPGRLLAAHAVSPAVQAECTARVRAQAQTQSWRLLELDTGEFDDERYLANPYDRCYFCKTHLYRRLTALADGLTPEFGAPPVILSGANTDDLGEHRPGLTAASEHGVRHPFVEAGVSKADIRRMTRLLGLDFWDIPASPCLASRVYTGTRVTPDILEAVALGEEFLKSRLNVSVVRCRVRQQDLIVELPAGDHHLVTPEVLAELSGLLTGRCPALDRVEPVPQEYRPGRAFTKEEA